MLILPKTLLYLTHIHYIPTIVSFNISITSLSDITLRIFIIIKTLFMGFELNINKSIYVYNIY